RRSSRSCRPRLLGATRRAASHPAAGRAPIPALTLYLRPEGLPELTGIWVVRVGAKMPAAPARQSGRRRGAAALRPHLKARRASEERQKTSLARRAWTAT